MSQSHTARDHRGTGDSVRGIVRAGIRSEVEEGGGDLVLTGLVQSLTSPQCFPVSSERSSPSPSLSSTANMTRRGPAAVLTPQSPQCTQCSQGPMKAALATSTRCSHPR